MNYQKVKKILIAFSVFSLLCTFAISNHYQFIGNNNSLGLLSELRNTLNRMSNDDNPILIKVVDFSESQFYSMYMSCEFISFFEGQNISISNNSKMLIPYLVIRIGEGYEIGIDNAGGAHVYDKYASNNNEVWFNGFDFEAMQYYINEHATEVDPQKYEGMFIKY